MAALKPQDLLVALKLVALGDALWTFPSLASDLGMSASEVHHATRRLAAARLYQPALRRVPRTALADFLVHGVPYAFPAEIGAAATGVPTARSAAPLRSDLVLGDDDELVWPLPHGAVRGHSVTPIYRSAPVAAARDAKLHTLLALVDSLRVGRARERRLAATELRARLGAAAIAGTE